MSGIPQARSKFFTGFQPTGLPQTFFTVPAGKIWRIWQASVQMVFQPNGNTGIGSIDAWIEIQGGDTLVAVSGTLPAAPATGLFSMAEMDQGGRALAPGTVVRLVSTGLPGSTIARITGGVLWSQI